MLGSRVGSRHLTVNQEWLNSPSLVRVQPQQPLLSRCSSTIEQRLDKALVVGVNPATGTIWPISSIDRATVYETEDEGAIPLWATISLNEVWCNSSTLRSDRSCEGASPSASAILNRRVLYVIYAEIHSLD